MPDAVTCVIVGGGGHARVLIDALQESRYPHRLAVVDSDPSLWGTALLDVPIIGGDDRIASLIAAGATHFAIGLGGSANNDPRRRLFQALLAAGLAPLTIVHPRAIVSRWARIGNGVQLLAGAIVNAGATVGDHVIVNSGAIVEHDCRVGDHAHIATGARLASGVSVGSGAHVGAGATVRQLITIGNGAIVGAGAVVVKDVAVMQIVAGVPAVPLERNERVALQR
jgi:sugar O-acyltransferase (sialic acid O-acetyltransferase NeuD family)